MKKVLLNCKTTEMDSEGRDWINLAEDMDQWLAVGNTVMNIWAL